MIRFIYAEQLKDYPVLANSMFQDRAAQFKHRLNWEVNVDDKGWELDEYDTLNPLYIVWEDANGRHAGSIRIMPTLGRTMTAEHFLHLTEGVRIASPLIWECTRFCLAPGASSRVAAGLLAAGIEMGLRFGLDQAIGVIYTRVLGIYNRLGHRPDIIGTGGDGRESISVGVWRITAEGRDEICRRAGIPTSLIAQWFDTSFNAVLPEAAAA